MGCDAAERSARAASLPLLCCPAVLRSPRLRACGGGDRRARIEGCAGPIMAAHTAFRLPCLHSACGFPGGASAECWAARRSRDGRSAGETRPFVGAGGEWKPLRSPQSEPRVRCAPRGRGGRRCAVTRGGTRKRKRSRVYRSTIHICARSAAECGPCLGGGGGGDGMFQHPSR